MLFNKAEILKAAHDSWIGCKVSDLWSNIYSAYNIRFRERTLKAEGEKDLTHLSAGTLSQMAEVEHNRWNVEKLLMGFRKPMPEEDAYHMDLSLYEKQEDKKIAYDDFKKTNNKNNISTQTSDLLTSAYGTHTQLL